MLRYFLLWSKKGHRTCTFWLRPDISSLSNCASSICLSLLFVSYFWSNHDVPRTKEFFVLFTGELLRVKSQWPSDSKVNVVKYIFKCAISCLAMPGSDIALTRMACIYFSGPSKLTPYRSSFFFSFSGRFYSRLLASLCLVIQPVSAEDK